MFTKIKVSLFSIAILFIVAIGCKKQSATSDTGTIGAATDTISIVSTPNPNIFPLLLALADNPSLKVKIIPVAEGSDLTAKLVSGDADGMTSMSYIAAKQVTTGKVPDLQIHSIAYWSGFYEIANNSVNNFNDLRGKKLVISGPVGNGQNGGPDIIFKAAMKRLSLVPGVDFQLEYLPLAQGTDKINTGQADAILLAEPAGTGLVLFSMVNQNSLKKAVNLQSIFNDFTGWPLGQMPIGGLSFKASVLNNAAKKTTFNLVKQAYESKATQLMNGNITDMQKVADKFNALYGAMLPQPLPYLIIKRAITEGSLVYRNDKPVQTIKTDLDRWIVELLGTSPGNNFYQ